MKTRWVWADSQKYILLSTMDIYDVGCVDDLYYIAMQYLSGPNLRDVLDSDEPYNHPLEILRPIIDALGYAHQSGVVHRDIKPANILFNESGRAILADFGISKSLNQQHTQLTTVNMAIGTAAYMSPEQAKGLADIDGRSDLYSIGVLLFEMLSGTQPYQSTDQMGLMLQHVNDPIPRLPESEQVYQPMINRLMAKDPAERYQDHTEVLDDIDALLNSKKHTSPARPKKTVLISGIAAAAVLAVGALALTSNISSDKLEESITAPVEPNVEGGLPETSVLGAEDSPEIQKLLELAKLHEEFGELAAPPGSNALEVYETILLEEPDHPVALARKDEIEKLIEN